MKKIFKISSIVVLAVATVCLQACKDNELSTDQYEGFSLAAFGPNPVMRGATLSFYGSHLENVTEVILPENVSVTDIEVVKSGVPSEIRIQLPDDGIVEGLVKLMAKDGSILSTKSCKQSSIDYISCNVSFIS